MNKKIIGIFSVLIIIFVAIFVYFSFNNSQKKDNSNNNGNINNSNEINDNTTNETNNNQTNEINNNQTNETSNNLTPDQYQINDTSIIADNKDHILIAKIQNISKDKLSISKINIIITHNNEQFNSVDCDLDITLNPDESYEFHHTLELPTDNKFVVNYNVAGKIID